MVRWCLVLATMALSLGACSSDEERHERSHHHSDYVDCSENVSCGTCTPVLGCGWCQFEDGSGRCVSGPGRCGETFRFNWNPEDCPASVAPTDAGPVDAPAASDAAPEAAAEVSVDDAADVADAPAAETASETAVDTGSSACIATSVPTGCAQSFGGTLCGKDQYTLGCTGTAKPESCTARLTEGATTHYCCACK